MNQVDVIPMLSIRPSCLTSYNCYQGLVRKYTHSTNFKGNKTKGIISNHAAKTLRIAMDWLLYFSPSRMVYYHSLKKKLPFRLSFLTLSLPSKQMHSDIYLKHVLLNQFNIELARRFNVSLYIWKAEAQLNGNIHFHYILNKYVYWRHVRKIWCRILNKLGYIDAYSKEWSGLSFNDYCIKRKKELPSERADVTWAFNFGNRTGWRRPNCVDIHKVRSVRDMQAYMMNYMLKNDEERRAINGRLWDMSELLSKFKNAVCIAAADVGDEFRYLINHCKKYFRPFEYVSMLQIPMSVVKAYIPNSKILSIFYSYISEIEVKSGFSA